jgi:hypothetical protein
MTLTIDVKQAVIIRVSSSAPSLPAWARLSDIAVKPATSARRSVPSTAFPPAVAAVGLLIISWAMGWGT